MIGSRVSRRTVVAGVLLAAAIVAVGLVAHFAPENLTDWVKDVGSTLVNGAAAVVIFWVAFQFQPGEAYRRPWLLIGIGVALYAVGDAVWTVIADAMGQNPYPSIADAFYLSEYVFLAVGILLAALAYRNLVSLRNPAIIAVVIAVVAAAGLWFLFLEPSVVAPAKGAIDASVVFSVIYPLADALLLLGPAVFAALVMSRLGAGRLAIPWWWVVVGAVLLAASDTAFSILDTLQSGGQTTALIESGWMAANVALAIGALLAVDVTGIKQL